MLATLNSATAWGTATLTASTVDSTVTVTLENWKFKTAWAEYGVACEQTVVLLEEQLAKDVARTIEMEEKLNQERRKNKRIKTSFRVVAVIAAVELAVIILLLWK